MFSPGAIFAQRYRMIGAIGKGGMGTVYLAEHTELARKVAIKVLLSQWSEQPSIARRFRVEARTVGALGHPNIVQVFDAGALPDGRLFLVMEHLAGRDLARELAVCRKFDPLRACRLMRQVALALATGHRVGVVHRDVKPSNVMLVKRPEGELAKVLDFGIAANAALSDATGRLTDPGSLVGTPGYMAPEQATDKKPTPAFDVYAVGTMLFELLTGALPFRAAHAFELLTLKIHRRAPRIDQLRPGLPLVLIDLIADCLATDPAARPADGDALVARFDEVLAEMEDEPGPALELTTRSVPLVATRRGWARSRWVSAALVAAVVFGVVDVLTLLSHDTANAATIAEVAVAAPEATPPARSESASEPPQSEPLRVEAPVESRSEPSLIEAQPLAVAEPSPAPRPAVDPAEPVVLARTTAPAPRRAPARVAAVTPSRPKPTPAVRSGDAYLTPRCQRVRTGAEEARRNQQWTLLRDNSRHQECWADLAEARKLQTKASMELGDFTGCIASGEDLRDPEVRLWLKLCQKRAGG